MQKRVSDWVATFLADKGIRHVFGIIGAGNCNLFDAIDRLGYTEIVCVHHEQAALMAMATYFRTSGKVSAALVTTGAGSTNAVTGVVSCWMDSVPGLILSGNENSKYTTDTNPLRIWGVQGYDSVEMVRKVTKYSHRVMEPTETIRELEKAYAITRSGRPGPVWLDIPMNVSATPVEDGKMSVYVPEPEAKVTLPPGPTEIIFDVKTGVQNALDRLTKAKRPVFWLGHGIRLAEATDQIPALLDKYKVPSLVTWAGIDMIGSDHPLVYGRAGVYGQRAANFVLQNSDLVIAIGTRLAIPQVGYDLTELAREAEFLSVDIDPRELMKYGSRIATGVCADAKAFVEGLVHAKKTAADYSNWRKQCDSYRERFPWVGPEHADADGFINSYRFMERLNRHFKPDQVVVTDMGTALLSGHQTLKFKAGQRLMTSTGLGEMGFGLPAAIGASFARDRGEVMCLNCDGGMMMNLQEIQTMVHHKLPIKVFIFNNDGYLMIKHTQKSLFKGHYAGVDKRTGLSCPDYSKIAHAFDIPAYQIRTWEDADKVLPEVQAATGPVFCEVFMSPEQPFVPKLSLAPQKDGTLISPPLEDLSPILPRATVRENMIVGMHPKSEGLEG